MFKTILITLLLFLPTFLMAQSSDFIDYVDRKLTLARYMEGECTSANFEGWKGFPLIKCAYQIKAGSKDKAQVIMLNANAQKTSDWIVDACDYIGLPNETCHQKLLKFIVHASGGQFAIAGVVYEDLNGNGNPEAYAFRHGVTVNISSIKSGTEKKLTTKQVDNSFNETVNYTYKFARVVSTNREQYYQYMKVEGLESVDVGQTFPVKERKNSWMTVIRELYQQAWNSPSNVLIRAWALANRDKLK